MGLIKAINIPEEFESNETTLQYNKSRGSHSILYCEGELRGISVNLAVIRNDEVHQAKEATNNNEGDCLLRLGINNL